MLGASGSSPVVVSVPGLQQCAQEIARVQDLLTLSRSQSSFQFHPATKVAFAITDEPDASVAKCMH
eukprot:7229849-Alexandrium_andersonii.AAC.1